MYRYGILRSLTFSLSIVIRLGNCLTVQRCRNSKKGHDLFIHNYTCVVFVYRMNAFEIFE